MDEELLAAWLLPEGGDALTFALAILRDIYADDAAVWQWLSSYRAEFGGASGLQLIQRGDGNSVKVALVRLWNRTDAPRAPGPTRTRQSWSSLRRSAHR